MTGADPTSVGRGLRILTDTVISDMIDAIRASDVFAELERMSSPEADNGPEGFTGDELSVHMGVGHRAAMYRIKEWCRGGLVEYAGRRRVVNNVGNISCIPVYRLRKAQP